MLNKGILNNIEEFIAQENIARYQNRLDTELLSANLRRTLTNLLIEEVSRLGIGPKQLAETERAAKTCKDRVEKQRALVTKLNQDGKDTSAAASMLETMIETHAAYEQRCRSIRATLAKVGNV